MRVLLQGVEEEAVDVDAEVSSDRWRLNGGVSSDSSSADRLSEDVEGVAFPGVDVDAIDGRGTAAEVLGEMEFGR